VKKHQEIVQMNDMINVSAESRTDNLNKLYTLMQVINNAATVRLKNDPQAMEKLTFPSPPKEE